jgi:hypothetical protein
MRIPEPWDRIAVAVAGGAILVVFSRSYMQGATAFVVCYAALNLIEHWLRQRRAAREARNRA